MTTHPANATPVTVVRSFVNTDEADDDLDLIGTPAALARWLSDQGLVDAGDPEADPGGGIQPPGEPRAPDARPADVVLAHDLRAALRRLLLHDGAGPGHATPDAELRPLERLSRRLPLRVALAQSGRPALVPAVSGVPGGLAQVLAAVVAMAPDDWERLKVCPADDCRWVFYDESRNRSRRWCSMEGCGNRTKVRSYRERTR